jgi:hypothetical protein
MLATDWGCAEPHAPLRRPYSMVLAIEALALWSEASSTSSAGLPRSRACADHVRDERLKLLPLGHDAATR